MCTCIMCWICANTNAHTHTHTHRCTSLLFTTHTQAPGLIQRSIEVSQRSKTFTRERALWQTFPPAGRLPLTGPSFLSSFRRFRVIGSPAGEGLPNFIIQQDLPSR